MEVERKLLKKYIEAKIVTYRFHKAMLENHKAKLAELEEELQRKSHSAPKFNTSSIIVMPDDSNSSNYAWRLNQYQLIEEEKKRIQEKQNLLDEVDTWLDNCCVGSQRYIINAYMIDNLCHDTDEVSKDIHYSAAHIWKTKERVVNRIISTFFGESV